MRAHDPRGGSSRFLDLRPRRGGRAVAHHALDVEAEDRTAARAPQVVGNPARAFLALIAKEQVEELELPALGGGERAERPLRLARRLDERDAAEDDLELARADVVVDDRRQRLACPGAADRA